MSQPREILTVAEMTAGDKAAASVLGESFPLMLRAGEAVAEAVMARFPPSPVIVLVGPGNNGGDGYVAAATLRAAGWPVRVMAAAPAKSADAIRAAALWDGDVEQFPSEVAPGAVYIDAVFGAGLDRPLAPEIARLGAPAGILPRPGRGRRRPERAERRHRPDRRRLRGQGGPHRHLPPAQAGPCAAARPRPLRRGPGRRHRAWKDPVAPMGEHPGSVAVPAFPGRARKRTRSSAGRLAVVSGEAWSTGAARLSARAGLRIGAGLVTLLSPSDALTVNAAHLEAVMLRPFETEQELEAIASDMEAAVIGPAAGVTEATLSNVLALARTGAALVVDADGAHRLPRRSGRTVLGAGPRRRADAASRGVRADLPRSAQERRRNGSRRPGRRRAGPRRWSC